VETALGSIASSKNPADLTALSDVLQLVDNTLNVLADSVLLDQPPVRRKKMEHLVSLYVKWCRHEQALQNYLPRFKSVADLKLYYYVYCIVQKC
jgi:hypothetical protein